MSFFKELKEDIAQSVSELSEALEDDLEGKAEDEITKKGPVEEIILEEPKDEPGQDEQMEIEQKTLADLTDLTAMYDAELQGGAAEAEEPEESVEPEAPAEPEESVEAEAVMDDEDLPIEEEPAEEEMTAVEKSVDEQTIIEQEESKEDSIMKEEFTGEINLMDQAEEMVEEMPAEREEEMSSEEITVITQGTTISGSIKSDTSLLVKGTIEGDVECQGKLTIVGRVAGNTIAKEIYVNTPRLEGDISSRGIVKIDVGTVVIGNVNCTSVVVAGAVKGNIDVNGPVIIDSTAVVKGDIRAKSVQVNSGAVIEGSYSLAYADVDLDAFFEQ